MGFFKKALGVAINPTAALGTALGAALGGAEGFLAYKGEKEAREADIASAREQMAFQERLSSTSHQREVADLKAAGLNPVLSANSGASTPSGASIDAENLLKGLPNAVSSARDTLRFRNEVRALDKTLQEKDSAIALNKVIAEKTKQDALNSARQGHILEQQFPEAEAESKFYREHPGFTPFKKILEMIGSGAATARDVGLTYRGLRGFGDSGDIGGYRRR